MLPPLLWRVMKKRYYIGDEEKPWWIDRLIDKGFIISIDSGPITDVLTYKCTWEDSRKHYLYEGDFLEYNTDTGSVLVGFQQWDSILRTDTLKRNFQKFQEGLNERNPNVTGTSG